MILSSEFADRLYADYVREVGVALIWLQAPGWDVIHANPAALALFRVRDFAELRVFFGSDDSTAEAGDLPQAACEIIRLHRAFRANDGDLTAAWASFGGSSRVRARACRLETERAVCMEVTRPIGGARSSDEVGIDDRLMHEFFDNTPANVFIKHRDGRYLLANRTLQKNFALPVDGIVGHTDHELLDKASADHLRSHDLQVIDGDRILDVEERIVINGAMESFISVKFPIYDEAGKPFALGSVSSNITARIAECKRLEESEELFRRAFENANEGICLLDSGGRFRRVNPALCRMLDHSSDEILGRRPDDFNHSENSPEALDRNSFAALGGEGGWGRHERVLRRRDGSPIFVNVSAALISDDPGSALRFIIHITDLSERRNLEQRLLRSEKLEVIGQLAGGIAHDINNLLAAIMGNAELLTFSLGMDSEKSGEYCRRIMDTAKRAGDFTSRLLAFAREKSLRKIPYDLHGIIREVVAILEGGLPARIGLDCELEAEACVVLGEPSQMQGALLNLGLNARDAIPGNGHIRYRTAQVFEAGEPVAISIMVNDDGVGMSGEVRKKVFDPFFTTKGAGRGTGLGLMSVASAAHTHEGEVLLTSEQGEGSTFTITIPLTDQRLPMQEVPDAGSAEEKGAVTLLVVDDDEEVRGIVVATLRREGYSVIDAANGDEGLEALRRFGKNIRLMLFDARMPVMGGVELQSRALRLRPKLPMILVTGFSLGEEARIVRERGVACVLQKPFLSDQLLDAVGYALKLSGDSDPANQVPETA